MTQIDKESVERLCHHIHNACDCQFGITDIEGTLRALRAALDAAEAERQKMERENQLQAEEIDKTRRRSDKWQSMVLDCDEYLKPDETPRQRMDRDHAESLALMKLYQAALERAEAAEARERAAVAAAYEKAAAEVQEWAELVGVQNSPLPDAIRALLDTDALAEYVERVRAKAYREGWRFAYRQWENTGSVPDPEYTPAAIRQETNDG
jgi:septal ring factor EnvC (AmiA/AmiB activator)